MDGIGALGSNFQWGNFQTRAGKELLVHRVVVPLFTIMYASSRNYDWQLVVCLGTITALAGWYDKSSYDYALSFAFADRIFAPMDMATKVASLCSVISVWAVVSLLRAERNAREQNQQLPV